MITLQSRRSRKESRSGINRREDSLKSGKRTVLCEEPRSRVTGFLPLNCTRMGQDTHKEHRVTLKPLSLSLSLRRTPDSPVGQQTATQRCSNTDTQTWVSGPRSTLPPMWASLSHVPKSPMARTQWRGQGFCLRR